jgi:hypothetical protein
MAPKSFRNSGTSGNVAISARHNAHIGDRTAPLAETVRVRRTDTVPQLGVSGALPPANADVARYNTLDRLAVSRQKEAKTAENKAAAAAKAKAQSRG